MKQDLTVSQEPLLLLEQIRSIDNPLFRKALICLANYLGSTVADKVFIGWGILEIWNLKDPRLDILVKVLRGEHYYKEYLFQRTYEQKLSELQRELNRFNSIKNEFYQLKPETDDIERFLKLVDKADLEKKISTIEMMLFNRGSGFLAHINSVILALETQKTLLTTTGESYRQSLNTILRKKISGISPRLLQHMSGIDTLPERPKSIYYWQNPFSQEETNWEQLDGALRYAETNAGDYYIEELVKKYFPEDWTTIYNKYRAAIFDRADYLSEQFEENLATNSYNFVDIIKQVDKVTSNLDVEEDILEKIGFILLDRHQAKVNGPIPPNIVAVFKPTLSNSDIDPEEDSGALFANVADSPISVELLHTIIIPHTDKTDFTKKLAWLMERLRFSAVQIEKAPILARITLDLIQLKD